MIQYNPDLISAKMAMAARQELINFINTHDELDDVVKETCIARMEEMLESYLLEFGVGWVCSKNLICRIKSVDFERGAFTYYAPIIFENFIAESLPLLRKLFNPNCLMQYVMQTRSQNPSENHLGRMILYKGYFGLELFQAMTSIYSDIPEIVHKPSEFTYMMESLMFNNWWNAVVNQDRLLLEYYLNDGSTKVSEVYIKPIIAVDKNRFFSISDCKLVDYSMYDEM